MATPAAQAYRPGDTRTVHGVPYVMGTDGRWHQGGGSSPAPAQGIQIRPPNPQAPIELERERVGLERDRVALEAAREGRNPQVANPGVGYVMNPDGTARYIPGGPADPSTPRNRSTRQLPETAINRLSTGTQGLLNLNRAIGEFRDDYAGNTITGGLENTIQNRISGFGTRGQAQWWADVAATDNVLRNALFGASLTEGEKAAWERTTVNPSMDPAQVRENLARRGQIAQEALRRTARTYRANGYNEDAIRESLGELQPIMDDARPATVAGEQPQQQGVGGVPWAHNLPDEPVNPLTPEQQGAYDAFMRANPRASADQIRSFFHDSLGLPGSINADAIVGARDREGGGIQPGSAAQYGRPDISAMRGPNGGALENVDAFMRGAADVATLGFADELSAAGNMLTSGGSYRDNLARERAIDAYDTEQNFYPRLGGQLTGGFALPMRATALPGMMREGAILGGLYGLGSGEGEGRIPSALGGAFIGAVVPPAFRGTVAAGGAVRSALSRPPTVAAAAAERQGIFLPRMDTGGTSTQLANSVVRNTPGLIPMASAAERATGSVAAARDRVASDIGAVADVAGAGQAAQRGMRAFLERSSARSGELHSAANRAVGADTPAQLSNTIAALEERTQGMPSNEALSAMFEDPRLSGYLGALREGGLSYTDLRRFRSLVGEMIEQPTVGAEASSTASLRRLYAGLSQDMEATASGVSPRALSQVRRAIQYDRGRHARREEIATAILGRDFRGSAEDAARQINRWSQERTGDFRAVGRALRSMPRDEANSVRASLFSRLGMARPNNQDAGGEVFSVSTFMTQWNQLDDRALASLVPNRAHREALNDIAEAASAMKQSSRLENMSRTGIAVNAAAIAAGLLSNPATTIVAVAGSYGAGRFLASPAGAGWLSRATRARTPSAIRDAITQLGRVASRDPAIAQEALGLQQALRRAMNDNVPATGRAVASPDEGPEQQ